MSTVSGGGGGATDSITEGDTKVETVDTGSDGHIKFTTDGTERMRLDNTGSLLVDKLGEKTSAAGVTIDGVLVKDNKVRVGDGTNNTTLAAAGSGGEFTLTLPSSAGSSGQYLKTDGSGNLSWDTVSSGATDSITEGNTKVEAVDTGSDGHIKFTTEGTERMRIIADGNIGIGVNAPTKKFEVLGNILSKGYETIIPPILMTDDTLLIATNSGVKRFGNFSNYNGDTSSRTTFGISGIFGDNNPSIIGTESLNIIQIISLKSGSHTNNSYYLLSSDGGIKCFGKNNYGELGFGNTNQVNNLTDCPFASFASSNGTKVIKMQGAQSYVVMLLENGRVLTAGYSGGGGLGRDNNDKEPNFMNEFTGTNDSNFAVDICCTNRTTYVVTRDGKLWSCGQDYIARGGNHRYPGKVTTDGTTEFTGVSRWSIDSVKNVNVTASSHNNLVFLDQNGKLYGFGQNYSGSLGIGHSSVVNYPTEIDISSVTPSISSIKSIFGIYSHSDQSGFSIISGNNDLYIVGKLNRYPLNRIYQQSYTFIMSNAKNIYYSQYDAIVQLVDNTLKSWGKNDTGKLVNGNEIQQLLPENAYTANLGSSILLTKNTSISKDNLLIDNGITMYSDDSSSNNTTLKAASSGGALTLTFPSSSGSAGYYLKTDGSGNLSWDTVSGASASIKEGDTIVETVDTGSDGHIKFSTEGKERVRVDNVGNVGIGVNNPTKN